MKKEKSIVSAVIAALLIACIISGTAFGAKTTITATTAKETTTMSSDDSLILQIVDIALSRAEERRNSSTSRRDLGDRIGLFTTKGDNTTTTKKGTTTTTKVYVPVTREGFDDDLQVNNPISIVVNLVVWFFRVIPQVGKEIVWMFQHPVTPRN
ncbi:MAG: hypothetical protein MJ121_05430 [Clostridia bacterium]|nr:hypothetical protein [Clostridia bacterium]